MKNNMKELLQVTNQGVDALKRFLDENPNYLTPDTAGEVREVFKEAFMGGDVLLAEVASMLASTLYLYLGQKYDSLYNLLDYYQTQFMKADSLDQYVNLYNILNSFTEMAKEINAEDLIFEGHVFAADCAFFGAQTLGNSTSEKEDMIMMAIGSLARASTFTQIPPEGWRIRFVSLLSACVELIYSMPLLDENETLKNEYLKQITEYVEKMIPLDFAYTDDDHKTEQTARNLAKLSYEYGSPDIGNKRLDIAIERLEKD